VRRRLLRSTLTVAAVAVILLGVPLAVAGAIVRLDIAEAQAAGRAESIGRLADEAASDGRPVSVESVHRRLRDGESVHLRLQDGTVMDVGVAPTGAFMEGRYASSTVEVVVRRDRSSIDLDIIRIALVVLGVAVVALLAAIAVGLLEGRRLTRPLAELARTAGRLGSRSDGPRPAPTGIDEVDHVAAVLERARERISTMLAAERQFASDASHQLRTPLTALSMRLEEIASTDDLELVREEARVALTQVERLAAVVDHLLAQARHTRSAGAVPVDVDRVVAQQAQEWRPSFRAAGRELTVRGGEVTALATPAGLSQVLATLLENTLVHGGGAVTISTRLRAGLVVVEVGDEGPGIPPELGARVFERAVSGRSGTGLGLAVARDLAEADGGRLELVQPRPAVFALFLRAAEASSAS
jgi:signal transduction histidine kinase